VATRRQPAIRRTGAGVSLDPNWDPELSWTSIAALVPLLDVLLPNRTEYDALIAAGVLADNGRCAVKDGKAGSYTIGAGKRVEQPAIEVEGFTDPVGAGDSFDAGYLAAIAHGVADESERLRWGNICGALSTRAAGGTAGQPTIKELRAWL
jgi:sugar/nucleoside kinase (ribokinase family)